MFKRMIIPLLLILFLASMVAFGAPVYVNIGPTTEFDGDIKILSEIVAEGTTPDGWETTVFFTDPTADNTITVPDSDATIGVATSLDPAAISGLAADTLAGADAFVFYDETTACPADADKTDPGICGCDVPDTDRTPGISPCTSGGATTMMELRLLSGMMTRSLVILSVLVSDHQRER